MVILSVHLLTNDGYASPNNRKKDPRHLYIERARSMPLCRIVDTEAPPYQRLTGSQTYHWYIIRGQVIECINQSYKCHESGKGEICTVMEYEAGVCNIGPEEIARRRNFGWGALATTVVLLLILIWTGVNYWWRLFVFFPSTMSASGFLQAYLHFCSGFAHRGTYSFGPLGESIKIDDELLRAKDKRRGNQIILYAALIGLAVAILSAAL